MPWFKVDDKLHSHVKAARAGVEALGLWTVAGSWCMDQLTNGFVPDYIAARLDPKYKRHAQALVRAGLWHEAEQDGDTGWNFHDWDEYQPTKDAVQEERRKARERMAKRRGSSSDVRANADGTSDAVRLPRPDPTRPDHKERSSNAPSPPPAAGERFDDFWRLYPRKVGKGQAQKAWKAAIKADDPAQILAGLRAQLPSLAMQRRTDGDYRPYPATWLNGERWADEPTANTGTLVDQRPEAWR